MRKGRPYARSRREQPDDEPHFDPRASLMCAASGCPLPGSMSRATNNASRDGYLCRYHFATDPRQWARVTMLINNRADGIADLASAQRNIGLMAPPFAPISGIAPEDGERARAFVFRVSQKLRSQILAGVAAPAESGDEDTPGFRSAADMVPKW